MSSNKPAKTPEFHTIQELAAAWRVTDQHLYNLIRRGTLPAFDMGGTWRIHREDAARFLQKSRATTAAKAA